MSVSSAHVEKPIVADPLELGTPAGLARGYVPALEGLRGVAIILVVLSHLTGTMRSDIYAPVMGFFGAGWTGVDLFFVLSGFLITRILLDTRDGPYYFRRFYVRRALRIWPAYYLAVAVAFGVVGGWLRHQGFYQALTSQKAQFANDPVADWRNLPLFLVYLQNFWLGDVRGFSVLAVTWSLCIEEHYYLVWPTFVRFFQTRTLLWSLLGLAAAFPFLRLALYLAVGSNYDLFHWIIYHWTPFHLDGIVCGSALAICFQLKPSWLSDLKRLWLVVAISGAIAIACVVGQGNGYLDSICYLPLAVAFTALVGIVIQGPGAAALSRSPLRFFGRISYSLYLIHPPLVNVLSSHTVIQKLGFSNHIALGELVCGAVPVAISIGLATVSWEFFESRILSLKSRLAP